MRVIGGKHKGKILSAFLGNDVRPTSDRAREALFNILSPYIDGCVFYDAFCGTGAVGIEAISRGANTVVFTDISKESVALTEKNLKACRENAIVCFESALDYLSRTSLKFDIIFIDPPYADSTGVDALNIISDRKLLCENGIAVFEHNRITDNRLIDGLVLYSTRKYGIAEFDFYRVNNG